jgi:hypothetical protein
VRSKLLVLACGFGCALFACAELIGLDKIKKCDDAEAVCTPDASDANVDATDAGDASDAFVLPDGVSEASSWPRWRMDNTPLEVLNGAADASRADFDAGAPDSGVITSAVTTLTWIAQLGFADTIDQAVTFCTNVGGRLPTRIELASILDSTRKPNSGLPFTAPAFDGVLLPEGGSPPQTLWSSSYARPIQDPLHYWFADLKTGDMLVQPPFAQTGVLCVR